MKRLLMLSYPFPPNASAGAVRSERFSRYLSELGWEIEVVTIKQRSDLFEDTSRLTKLGDHVKVHRTSTLDPWLWLSSRKPNNILLRAVRSLLMILFSFPDHMLLWVPFAVWRGLAIHRQQGVDAFYSTSPPHTSHLAGLILTRLTGKPWIADFRDPWTLNAYRLGQEGGLSDGIERFLEKKVLQGATRIIANTEANRNNLLQAFPYLDDQKVVLLPNGWEPFDMAVPVTEAKESLLTIVHAGTFYPKFRPYGLLEAFSVWKRRGADDQDWRKIRIILIGSGDGETRRKVKELDIEDVVDIKPWLSLEEARSIMLGSDLLWATLGCGKESASYVPSKLFEYMAAQRPIIGFFPEGQASSLIRRTETGTVFSSDDPGPIIDYLQTMLHYRIRGEKLPYQPNQEVVASYNVRNIVKRFHDLLTKMCSL